MTDKEKTIKELKEALDSLDVTNKYRLNLIRAIEYLQEEPVSEELNARLACEEFCSVCPHNNNGTCYIKSGTNEQIASKDFEMTLAEMIDKAQKCVVEPWVVAAQWKDELIKLAKSEEPVREDLEEAAKQYEEDAVFYAGRNISDFFKAGAKWQKQKDESTTEDLGEYINELSKQFPEVSFAKLSRIAVRVAKWQKQKDEKAIDENALLYNARLEGIEIGKAEMKQQMMAKAIDGDITFDYYGDDDKIYGCIAHNSFCLEDFGLKDRDKVKVIVIKED